VVELVNLGVQEVVTRGACSET